MIINRDDPILEKKYADVLSNKLIFSKDSHAEHGAFISDSENIQINLEENILIIKGSVPGKPGNLLSIVPSE